MKRLNIKWKCKMNQKKQLLRNTVIIAIGKLSTQIISFLLLPLYTSKLSPAQYGTYDFLVTLSIFLLPVITMLMEESMFRFLIDAEDLKNKKRIITATITYTAIGTLLFTTIASIVMTIMKYEYAFVFILFIISNVLIGLSNSLARGTGKIKLYSLSNFVLGASTIILNVLLIVVFKLGINGLLWSNTIANTLTAVIVLKKLHLPQFISKKDLNKKTMLEMLRYSIPLVPNNLSWIIISLSDRLMLTWLIGTDANGLFSIAYKFPNIIYTCYGFFSTAWKESAAKILKENNKTQYYSSIYKDIKFFLKAIVLGLIAIMPFAFPLLVDPSYNEAYKYIPILVISIYYTNMSNFYGGIFTAYKNTKIMGTTTFVAAILNVVINLIFIPKFGIYAAAFSTLISNIIVFAYRRYRLKDYIKLREKFNYVFWVLLIITLITYYQNNMTINIIMFIIVIAYCIITNLNFMKKILQPIINKFVRLHSKIG